MKKFLFFLLIVNYSFSQLNLAISNNSVDITNSNNGSLYRNLRNISAINYEFNLVDPIITIYTEGTPFKVNFSQIANVSVDGGTMIEKTTFTDLTNQFKTRITNLSGGSGTVTNNFTPVYPSFGTTADAVNIYTTNQTITTTNCIFIIIENLGTTATTVSYGGVNIPLAVGQERLFEAVFNQNNSKYTPISTLSVLGTATASILVTRKFLQ
jgi:hypothetical protein